MKKKIIYDKEQYKIQQFLLKNKKTQRDLAIHNEKMSLLEKKKELKNSKIEVQNQIIDCLKQTEKFYYHTQRSENELISYIAFLLSKMYLNSELTNPKIIETYKNTNELIEKYQIMKSNELSKINKEIENKAIEWFDKKEKEQSNKLLDQLNLQEKIFVKMREKKKELSEIKDNFRNINDVMEKCINKRDELKIKRDLIKNENDSLIKIKNELSEQYDKLKEKCNKIFGNNFNILSDDNNMNFSLMKDIYEKKLMNMKKKIIIRSASASTSLSYKNKNKNKNESESIKNKSQITPKIDLNYIIHYLINENKKIKKHYNDIVFIHSQIMRNDFNLKILIEKCIEDLNYQYKNLKYFNQNKNKGLNPIMYGKINPSLPDIEKSLYIFSYIHDNVLGKNKIKTLIKSNSLITIRSKTPLLRFVK